MPTLFIGNNTIRLPIVESTNTYSQDLLKHSTPIQGTIVIADEQTQGRGQRGNTWLSDAGKNLTLSLILYPTALAAENQFILTQLISLALVDFIATQIGPSELVKIKWPNDIYVGEKKIAGVLIENSIRGSEISVSIIGIGMNINQEVFKDVNATSLINLANRNFDLNSCLSSLCSCIEARYIQFINKNMTSIKLAYHEKLFRLNITSKFELAKKRVDGKIIGVNSEGKLQLSLSENFGILELGSKEVMFVI